MNKPIKKPTTKSQKDLRVKITNLGKKGEIIAEKYFIDKGFAILDKNYRKRIGEIDLVCIKDKKIHFIEVKTIKYYISPLNDPKKDNEAIGANFAIRPEDNLHPSKIKKVLRMAELYILDKKLDGTHYQIDGLAVYILLVNDANEKIEKIRVRYVPNLQVS